jgi:hypothetical protein
VSASPTIKWLAEAKFVVTDLREPRVYGLNLSVPEDAKAVIKPWNEREQTDKFAESGVDDQVSFAIVLYFESS